MTVRGDGGDEGDTYVLSIGEVLVGGIGVARWVIWGDISILYNRSQALVEVRETNLEAFAKFKNSLYLVSTISFKVILYILLLSKKTILLLSTISATLITLSPNVGTYLTSIVVSPTN